MTDSFHITDPVNELLAIKLHEHSCVYHPQTQPSWIKLTEEQREYFRAVARGKRPLSDVDFFRDVPE